MFAVPEGPAEAKISITVRCIHLIRRPYAKRRRRRETMFEFFFFFVPYCKNIVKILDNNATTLVSKRPLVDD